MLKTTFWRKPTSRVALYYINIFSCITYNTYNGIVDEWQIFSSQLYKISFCTRECARPERNNSKRVARRGCRTRRISKGPRVTCRANSAIRLFNIIIIIIIIITLLCASGTMNRWRRPNDRWQTRINLHSEGRDAAARPENKRVMAGVVRPPPSPREQHDYIITITIAIYFYHYYYYCTVVRVTRRQAMYTLYVCYIPPPPWSTTHPVNTKSTTIRCSCNKLLVTLSHLFFYPSVCARSVHCA